MVARAPPNVGAGGYDYQFIKPPFQLGSFEGVLVMLPLLLCSRTTAADIIYVFFFFFSSRGNENYICDRLSKTSHVCTQTEIHFIAPAYSYTK